MASLAEPRRRTWADLLLLAGILWTFGLVIHAALRSSEAKADVSVVSHEAKLLHEALTSFHEQNGVYPGMGREAVLDRASLNPLRERGYYEAALTARLADARVDAYVSSDGHGSNDEFWIEMSLASDPSIRFLVARSDDAPLGGGHWRDGAFIFRDDVLDPL